MNCIGRMINLGITYNDARALRRIAMTLARWHELECGTGNGQTTYSVERDDEDGPPFMRVQYPTANGYVDQRWRTPDRERGALKRLAKIMANYPTLDAYVQGDPRGASLYVGSKEDMTDQTYNRGVAVVK